VNELGQLLVSRWTEVTTFLLILGRTSAMVLGAPFWGGSSSPKLVRVVVSVGLSAAVYPFALPMDAASGAELPSLTVLLSTLVREVLIGLAVGWSSHLLFAGMRMAGQYMELKMGLGLTQLVDPHEGGQTSLIPALLDLTASLVFLAMNGHHLLIRALVSSYEVFPLPMSSTAAPVKAAASGIAIVEVLSHLVESAGALFPIALRVSAPVLIGALLADVILGIISRVVPQLNLFAVILPAQFAFGLLLLFLALPLFVWFCVEQLSTINHQLGTLFTPIPLH
jgi:flagellar biosynthetic protein FliR